MHVRGIWSAYACEELVYKDGSIAECVFINRSVCGDLLFDSVGLTAVLPGFGTKKGVFSSVKSRI